jgi:hypothetical protein
MKSAYLLIWISLTVFLGGCATGGSPLAPYATPIDSPAVGAVNESELGETILSAGIVYQTDAVVLKNEIVGGDGVIRERSRLRPQQLLAVREDTMWTYYEGTTTYMGQQQIGGLMISKQDRSNVLVWGGSFNRGTKPTPIPILEFIKVVRATETSFRQELIYNGRAGSTVRFTYREFSDSMIRPAFSQDATYDLLESKVIGFKGARIEVIEASNTKLKYRVLASFPKK